MGLSVKEGKRKRFLRGVKTIVFLIYMIISFLFFSVPVLIGIADIILPSVLLTASLPTPPSSLQSLTSNIHHYDFRNSLIDIPIVSIVRSTLIICVYSLCDGPALTRVPYMGIAAACSLLSLVFISLKASYLFALSDHGGNPTAPVVGMFLCSMAMSVAHVVIAYRTSCRERRKLLVYKIDLESVRVTASKKGYSPPRYYKQPVSDSISNKALNS